MLSARRLTVFAAAVLMLSLVSVPVLSEGHEADMDEIMAEVTEALKLSEDQVPRMQTALTNYFTNLDAVHAKYENQEEPDGQEMIGDLKKTRDGYYKELKGFLSEDQYNGYMELKEKVLHEIFSEIAGLRLYDFKEPLKLTDDQMTKMKPILGDAIRGFFGVIFEYGDKRMSVRNKLKIANALKGIQSDTNEKIKPILTPEQWETWQKMKEAAKEEG